MADHPMLFSPAMIRALLAGRKTQTRRLLPAQPKDGIHPIRHTIRPFGKEPYLEYSWHSKFGARLEGIKTRVSIGDRIYAREAWRVSKKWDETAPRDLPRQTMTVFLEAGGSIANQKSGKWEPDFDYPDFRPDWVGKFRQAMHMPRWASRLTLMVYDVRIERLRDISEADARAEGANQYSSSTRLSRPFNADWKGIYREGYAELWNEINGAGAWEANPWVVAYTFRVVRQNIDQIEKAAA